MTTSSTAIELAPGRGWSSVLETGDELTIVDLFGQQAVDFLCYRADDRLERYDLPETWKNNGSIFLGPGMGVFSTRATRLLTVVADTYGRHDQLGGCCSRAGNLARHGAPGSASCRETFLEVLTERGMDERDIVPNINWFMRVGVTGDGTTAIEPSGSQPGDTVRLRAEMRVLVVISNCVQIFNPANGFDPTPISVDVTRAAPDQAAG